MSAQGNDPPDAGVPGGGDAAIAPPPAERDSGAGGAGAAPAGTGGDAAPVPAVGDPPALSVQYLATNAAPQDNVIAPTLQLSLTGGDSVELAGIELRYYFSNEHATQCPGGCKVESYYAGVHPSGMSVMARRSYVSTGGNAAYLSISFDAAAGSLHAGESVELQQQFHTDPYSDFDERDDYSFDPTRSTLGDTSKVTVYRDGKLVWGTPPP